MAGGQQEKVFLPDCYLWCIVKNRRYDELRKREGFENFLDLDEVI